MPIDLYYMVESPPCRTVLMVANRLNIELNLKTLDLSKGEHLNPEFVELNPFHCVPTIVDEDLVLWESRAIITYLVNRYYPSHSLYPSDSKTRATIDKFLNYDLGTFYKNISSFAYPLFFGGQREQSTETKLKETLNLFDSFVTKSGFVCGEAITLADISLISGITLLESIDYELSQWSNVCQWIARVKDELKDCFEEINSKAIQNTREYLKHLQNAKD